MTETLTHTPTATDDRPLAGRVALITGASSGIGASVARHLADAGATVAAVARRADRLAELGGDIAAVPADVTDPDALTAAVERAVRQIGRPDLVVANAGISLPSPAEEGRLGEWQRMIDVNVTGLATTVAVTVPHLVAAGRDGRTADLVLLSSILDSISIPGMALYSASKAMVTKLAHDLRLELSPFGVRTLNVRPGLVATEITSAITDPDALAQFEAITASMDPLTPDDVARAVVAAVSMPSRVNISELAIVPTSQPAPV